MYTRSIRQRLVGGLVALIVLSLLAIPATANHSWGTYHWARTSNNLNSTDPVISGFTLKVGDNVSGAWDGHLDTAILDWNKSSVLNLEKVAGAARSPKTCKATRGRIEVCNASYGNNGWLGIAQIYVSGSHITQGISKQNDTYFNTAKYNTPAWRQLVICQEIAHAFGLDHQDENFDDANLGSCMDYTSNPLGPPSNEHPNAHDFAQLETIYTHLDTTTTIGASTTAAAAAEEDPGNDPRNWGNVLERDGDGRPSLYGKDLAPGKKLFTFVIYADTAEDATVDDGTGDGGTGDGGRNDGGKGNGGKKADSKQDGGKKDKKQQRHHDGHNH